MFDTLVTKLAPELVLILGVTVEFADILACEMELHTPMGLGVLACVPELEISLLAVPVELFTVLACMLEIVVPLLELDGGLELDDPAECVLEPEATELMKPGVLELDTRILELKGVPETTELGCMLELGDTLEFDVALKIGKVLLLIFAILELDGIPELDAPVARVLDIDGIAELPRLRLGVELDVKVLKVVPELEDLTLDKVAALELDFRLELEAETEPELEILVLELLGAELNAVLECVLALEIPVLDRPVGATKLDGKFEVDSGVALDLPTAEPDGVLA